MAVSNQFASEQTSSMRVERGLYALRYVGSASNEPPIVHVRASFGSEHDVKIVSAPGEIPSVLTAPNCVLVLVVEESSVIQMTIQAKRIRGSLDAQIKLEPLQRMREEPAHPSHLPPSRPGGSTQEHALQFVCHVARQGDVDGTAGAWIAGPEAPAQIEGITLWTDPEKGVDIECQVFVQGQRAWSAWAPSGQYAGTKGRAMPLAGLRLRLVGPAATKYRLTGSALFLGSNIIDSEGSELEFLSPSGRDPLVGLKIDLKPRSQPQPSSVPASADSKRRVRVFRAGVEQS